MSAIPFMMTEENPLQPHPNMGTMKLPLSAKEFEAIGNDETILSLVKNIKLESFKEFVHINNETGSVVYKELRRRWDVSEVRVKDIEKFMLARIPVDKTIEDDRFDILSEMLDKACQAFEIADEHVGRGIPLGKRIYLDTCLLLVINQTFDCIYRKMTNLSEFNDGRDAAINERDIFRIEIRTMDLQFAQVHERYMLSFLDMDWP
uniref:NR LBD domain-containing protein n=1 Tax=Rhabditophanes sp. KR3021 TaxID=114890 RepID=A0AC35TNM2_9BILA